MTGKKIADRAVSIAAAVAAPVIGLLVHEHTLSSLTGFDVGLIVTAFVGAWHGGSIAQARLGSPSVQAPRD